MTNSICITVSSPDPAPKREKDLIYIEHFLGRTGNSMSYDSHDSASFAIVGCHMIITCKPHGVNLIGVSKFRNKPKKALDVHQTLLPLWGGVWGRDYLYEGWSKGENEHRCL